jgi:hypothetical protein
MELVSFLQVLSRHRITVGIGALAALLAGLAVMGALPIGPGGGVQSAGAARARVLVDMPRSLVTDVDSNADTVGAQANMLMDLMAADPQVRAIAQAAHAPAREVVVLRPALTTPTRPSPLAEDASQVAGAPGLYTVTLTADVALPIVTIEARAPNARAAAALVRATAATLRSLAQSRAPTPRRAMVVRPLEPVRSITLLAGQPRKSVAVAVAALVFVFWCVGMVLAASLIRALRRRPSPPVEASE